jgi:hypothetical protein
MHKRPTLSAFFTALLATLLLLPAANAPACPPPRAGLEALIELSVQAIEVEIVEVELIKPSWLIRGASLLREVAVSSSKEVSEDLAMVIADNLPEVKIKPLVLRVHARVLDHLDPEGPKVGTTFSWRHDSFYRRLLSPPHRAVIFLDHRSPKLPLLGLIPTGEIDSVASFAEHQDLSELSAVIRSGFENKRSGTVATPEWLEAAFRSPTSRLLLRHKPNLVERLTPDLVADALIERPTGTPSDVFFLEHLAAFPRDDLDLFALELTETWLANEYANTAKRVARIALERWAIPAPASFEEYSTAIEDLAISWRLLVEENALPVARNPRIQTEIDAWTQAMDEAREFYLELRALSNEG